MLALVHRAARRSILPFRGTRLTLFNSLTRSLSSHPGDAYFEDENELRAAQDWLDNFQVQSIPRKDCIITFSRASGPGGQNVNKVNSKATLRLPCNTLFSLIPTALHAKMRESRFYAAKSHSIVLQADSTRSQRDNVDECIRKLYEMIVEAGRAIIPGTTSQAQKKRVQELRAKDTKNRIRAKRALSQKKDSRKSGGGLEY